MIRERKVIGRIEILEGEIIQIREDRIILDDDTELTRLFHRRVLNPGDDTTLEDNRLRAITAILWTPEVINAYKEKRAKGLEIAASAPHGVRR